MEWGMPMMSESVQSLPRVVAATITPCQKPGEPDLVAMEALCRHLVGEGCDGLFVVGSTGEAPLLSRSQRRELIRAARKGSPSTALFCGATALGEEDILNRIRDAADEGADVAVLMVPYFLKLSQTQLRDYLLRLVEASALPVGFYNHFRMPTVIAPETVAELAAHEKVLVLKETAESTDQIAALLQSAPPGAIAFYQGREHFVLESLRLGARGSVTALANGFAAEVCAITTAWEQGDDAAAEAAQRRYENAWKIFREPEVGVCFSRFAQAVSQPLRAAGILTSPGCVSGEFEPAFDQWVGDFYRRAAEDEL